MDINTLVQTTTEDLHCKKNIHAVITKDIESGMEDEIQAIAGAIAEYRGAEYSYDSKIRRVRELSHQMTDSGTSVRELAIHILSAVMAQRTAQPIQSVCGRLEPLLGFDNVFDGITTAAELLAVGEVSGAYEFIAAKDSEIGSVMVQSLFELDEETYDYIDNTMYLPPMVCEPQKLKHNYSSAYLTINQSVVLNGGYDYKLRLSTLDRMNTTAYAIDEFVMGIEEEPTHALDTTKKQDAFDKLADDTLEVADYLIENGNKFYLENRPDHRGRSYTQGYHINPQGNEYRKALINLHHKEIITGE